MATDKQEVDQVAYGHTKNFLGALMAFSIATVLLCVQGSIPVTKAVSQFGVVLLTLAIPASLFGFVLNVKVLRYETVSTASLGLVHKFIGSAILLGIVGFGCLIYGASGFLGSIFAVGSVVAFLVAWRIVYKFDQLNSKDDSDA